MVQVECYLLDLEGLISQHSMGSGTKLLDRESFQDVLSGGSCKVLTGWMYANEAKQQLWEERGEAMEKDFKSAPRCFWKTIRHLSKGKRETIQALYSKGRILLTSTEEVIGW